jgi:hypothetical protein
MPGLICVLDSTRNPNTLADGLAANTYGAAKARVLSWTDGRVALRKVINTKHEPFSLFETDEWVAALWGYPRFQGKTLSRKVFESAVQQQLLDSISDLSYVSRANIKSCLSNGELTRAIVSMTRLVHTPGT